MGCRRRAKENSPAVGSGEGGAGHGRSEIERTREGRVVSRLALDVEQVEGEARANARRHQPASPACEP